jgi:pimeloyl-ACP methyl ester carboxylesterase
MGNSVIRWVGASLSLFALWYATVDRLRVREAKPPPGDPGRFVDVDGTRTYYRVAGSGPPLLLLHGMAMSSYSWRRNTPALAGHFTVYAPDIRGFGYSDKPRGEYTNRELAGWTSEFLKAVGVQRAGVIGHSMGGEVALWLGIDHPDQVARILTVGATGGARLRKSFKALSVPVVGELMLKTTNSFLLRLSLAEAYTRTELITREMAALYDSFNWSPGYQQNLLRRVRNQEREMYPLRQKLSNLSVPVLAVWGDRDAYFTVEEAMRFVEPVPNKRLLILPGGGHMLHEEQPEEFNRMALDWLGGRKPVSAAH